jgi:hypothetical protein
MIFSNPLRPRVMSGEITESIRVWLKPKVRAGGRYALGPGSIEVTSITEIAPERVTDKLAQRTGFEDAAALWKMARHGPGDRVYLVRFVYDDEKPPPVKKTRRIKLS